MDPSSPTYYDLLEITPSADLVAIRQAFRRLARRYHPDVNPGDRTALERFQQISHAYQVLSDPAARSRYDATLQGATWSDAEAKSNRTATEWYQQGLQLTQQGRYANSIEAYTQALHLNPQLLEAYDQRGFSYYKLGKTVEAFADFAEAMTLNDQQATSYYYRGLTRLKLGYNQGAIADFSQAIALDPDHGQAYYHRGISYRELEEYSQAQQDFIQAEQILIRQQKVALAHDARAAYRQLDRSARISTVLFSSLRALPGDLAMVLLRVVTQPRQSMAICSDRLPPPRANLVSLILLTGFVLTLVHTVNSRWSNVRAIGLIEGSTVGKSLSWVMLIGLGLTPFIIILLGSVLTQVIAKQPVKWRLSYFLAGIGLFPLYGIILAGGWGTAPVFGFISLIGGGYLLLLLYGGCRYGLQCNHAIAITSAICLTGIIALLVGLLIA
ncbi:MAG: DnaJ domain-containing protein [Leptolyngbyaceae cyanobacterium]